MPSPWSPADPSGGVVHIPPCVGVKVPDARGPNEINIGAMPAHQGAPAPSGIWHEPEQHAIGTEAWAILCRHPFDAVVPQHCPVARGQGQPRLQAGICRLRHQRANAHRPAAESIQHCGDSGRNVRDRARPPTRAPLRRPCRPKSERHSFIQSKVVSTDPTASRALVGLFSGPFMDHTQDFWARLRMIVGYIAHASNPVSV
jgi:hypothetical protein